MKDQELFLFLSCGRCTVGWALPKELAVLEGEEGCTLALGSVNCLVGDMIVVVVVVVNSPGVWLTVAEETTLPKVGDMSVCGIFLQMTSEVLVPLICTPDLHLQRMKCEPRVRNTGQR